MKILLRALAFATAYLVGAHASAQPLSTRTGPIQIESLAKLDNPWGMAFLPDGRLLITEKPGRLRIYADRKLSQPIGGLPEVAYRGQGGLLDVEIDPDFARNGYVYLYYTEPAPSQPPGARDTADHRLGSSKPGSDSQLKGGAVARGKLANDQLTRVSVIWRQVPKTIGRGHFGGRLVFGRDGKLFVTSGERQRFEPAQDLSANLGKVVRINADGSIPMDNPFAHQGGARQDIWSLGHRNPLGAAINPATGELWESEMGPRGGDEINVIQRGGNHGWPIVSAGSHYDGTRIPRHSTHPEFALPVHSWNPSISPSGLLFYTGDRFPAWRGNLLLGGLSSMALLRLTLDGNKVTDEERIALKKRIRDVIQAPDGAVLLLTDGDDAELLRVTPR